MTRETNCVLVFEARWGRLPMALLMWSRRLGDADSNADFAMFGHRHPDANRSRDDCVPIFCPMRRLQSHNDGDAPAGPAVTPTQSILIITGWNMRSPKLQLAIGRLALRWTFRRNPAPKHGKLLPLSWPWPWICTTSCSHSATLKKKLLCYFLDVAWSFLISLLPLPLSVS